MLGLFLDQETTGLDSSTHRVLEVACKAVDLSNGTIVGSFDSLVKQPPEVWDRRDPISIEVNGFKWEDLAGGREEKEVSAGLILFFQGLGITRSNAFFLCQNPAFDRAFFGQLVSIYTQEQMRWPYHWLDFASMYWALTVRKLHETNQRFPEALSLSKDSIASQFGLPTEARPHRAMNGVDHLILCYGTVVGWAIQPHALRSAIKGP